MGYANINALVNGLERILPTKWVLAIQLLLSYCKSIFADYGKPFFANLSFFLLLWWPSRPWEITTSKRQHWSAAYCQTFVYFAFGIVVLLAGFFYKAGISTFATTIFSALYYRLTDYVPEIAITIFLPLALCISSPQIDVKPRVALYVFLLVIIYYVGILTLLLFCVIFFANIYDTYGPTSKVRRYLVRTFTTSCCSALISDYIGLMSTIWKVILFYIIVQMHVVATRWVHGFNDFAVLVEHDYRERFFRRGNAKTQIDFVTRHLRVFLFIIFVSALCTMDLLRCSDFTPEPETVSNVFCKIDNERQLECLVQVSYADPYAYEPEKCQCSNISSAEWDFCGVFALHLHIK